MLNTENVCFSSSLIFEAGQNWFVFKKSSLQAFFNSLISYDFLNEEKSAMFNF